MDVYVESYSNFLRKNFIEILMLSPNIGVNKQFIFKFIINYYGISSETSLEIVFTFFLN